MGSRWQVHTAKARFRELLDKAVSEGPQIVTRRGIDTAVVVPLEQWRSLQRIAEPNLKELLLASEPRTESLAPPSRRLPRRSPQLE